MKDVKMQRLALPNVDIDKYVQERWVDFVRVNTRNTKPTGTNYQLGDAGIHGALHPLIEKLALKRPEWQFVACYGSFDAREGTELIMDFEVRDIQVFDKRELLGRIEVSRYSWKAKRYDFLIGNHRTSAMLSRANAFKTSDVDKAAKLVLKHFGARNDQELYDEAYRIGIEQLSIQHREKVNISRRLWSHNDDKAFAFILNHWDEFLMTVTDVREREPLSKLPEVNAECSLLGTLYQSGTTSGGDAYTIYQQGDYYLMSDDAGGLTKKSGDELPNNVRHKLGVLKLVKDGQAVSDIGFRANETTFIVFKDKE